MTKTEVKENITKITQILQSENCEAGFELLKTKNDPALNEELSDLIQSRVKEKYIEEGKGEGLEILSTLLPNLTSLDLNSCYSLQNVDGLANLTNLTSLDLGACDSLQNVDGLEIGRAHV